MKKLWFYTAAFSAFSVCSFFRTSGIQGIRVIPFSELLCHSERSEESQNASVLILQILQSYLLLNDSIVLFMFRCVFIVTLSFRAQ